MNESDIFRFRSKVKIRGKCWIWAGAKNSDGYGSFKLNGRAEKSHRIAYILKHGSIPNGMHVLHRCDTPACCNPDHLFLGTHQDNIKDMDSKGRRGVAVGDRNGRRLHPERWHVPWGDGHSNTKLSEADLVTVREMLSVGIAQKNIAERFNVSESLICQIAKGKARNINQVTAVEIRIKKAVDDGS